MTRDEAIAVWDSSPTRCTAGQMIDTFVALGMLKLDEPKNAWDKFREAVIGYDSQSSDLTLADADSLAARIDRAGLKIVEK